MFFALTEATTSNYLTLSGLQINTAYPPKIGILQTHWGPVPINFYVPCIFISDKIVSFDFTKG